MTRVIDRVTVRDLTEHGWSARRIANHLGCSTRSVVRARSALGIGRPRQESIPPKVLDGARRLMLSGASRKEAARTFPVSEDVLARRFPELKWTSHQAGVFRQATNWDRLVHRERERKAS